LHRHNLECNFALEVGGKGTLKEADWLVLGGKRGNETSNGTEGKKYTY
jgi:hypothetical protein